MHYLERPSFKSHELSLSTRLLTETAISSVIDIRDREILLTGSDFSWMAVHLSLDWQVNRFGSIAHGSHRNLTAYSLRRWSESLRLRLLTVPMSHSRQRK